MSLLERSLVEEHDSAVRPWTLRLDDLEETFRQWAHDPAKPDHVTVGEHRELGMVELARRLTGSRTTLPDPVCAELGLPFGVTIATAAAQLLDATVDPHGPRCRSFRSAIYYLRGLAHLGVAFDVMNRIPDEHDEEREGSPDVR